MSKNIPLSFQPLTPECFGDFEQLFGSHGACGGCWCMFWKLRGRAFDENTGEPARQMQKSIVESGTIPGLLAYASDKPIGWIAVEPRGEYPRLAHSRVLKPVDGKEVWSVTCFFVDRKFRKQGVTIGLLKAAIEFVRSKGGRIVEGYPTEAREKMPDVFIYTGTMSTFQKAGFKEVARQSPTRPIVRKIIHK
jgi:GNAT superfamily N-acetyltransferase